MRLLGRLLRYSRRVTRLVLVLIREGGRLKSITLLSWLSSDCPTRVWAVLPHLVLSCLSTRVPSVLRLLVLKCPVSVLLTLVVWGVPIVPIAALKMVLPFPRRGVLQLLGKCMAMPIELFFPVLISRLLKLGTNEFEFSISGQLLVALFLNVLLLITFPKLTMIRLLDLVVVFLLWLLKARVPSVRPLSVLVMVELLVPMDRCLSLMSDRLALGTLGSSLQSILMMMLLLLP